MATTINRPETEFTPHEYTLKGEKLYGISTVSHVGGAEDDFGVGSAWGFRIGYEGAWDVIAKRLESDFGEPLPPTKDALREALKDAKLTPWDTRDEAAERGTWVHDVLEELAQHGDVPDLDRYVNPVRGHVLSILRWYTIYQPLFVATEVQVTSEAHHFAGRYDIRCLMKASQLVPLFDKHTSPQAERIRTLAELDDKALSLVDLKTSKKVIPTKHFVQLSGYDLAGVEMGFDPTDAQFILLSHEDGSPATLAASWSQPGDFLAYLEALKVMRRIKDEDPENRLKRNHEDWLIALLKANPKGLRSRDLVDDPKLDGMTSKEIGSMFGSLARRDLAAKGKYGLWLPGRRLARA